MRAGAVKNGSMALREKMDFMLPGRLNAEQS